MRQIEHNPRVRLYGYTPAGERSRRPDLYYNLKAEPVVRVEVGNRTSVVGGRAFG